MYVKCVEQYLAHSISVLMMYRNGRTSEYVHPFCSLPIKILTLPPNIILSNSIIYKE